ncbi:MAG: hypothetical protein IT475_11250 [Aquimonas sp.]|nr:hypothetical protein [Aquimonas sp.]
MSNTLQGMVLIRPLISIATGTVAVDRNTDLAGAILPPSSIVSDGRKRVVDPKVFAPMVNIRKSVERAIQKVGSPFVGSHLVPEAKLADLEVILQSKEADFLTALDELIAHLDQHVHEFAKANPEWAHLIRNNALNEAMLRERCAFQVAMFKPAAPEKDPNGRYSAAVNGAIPAVLADVAGEADDVLKIHFEGTAKAGQRAVSAVAKLLTKMEGFSILDPRIAPCVQNFKNTLDALPKTGVLKGGDFFALHGLAKLLTDQEGLLEYGESVFADLRAPTLAISLPAVETPPPGPPVQAEAPVTDASTPPPPSSGPMNWSIF